MAKEILLFFILIGIGCVCIVTFGFIRMFKYDLNYAENEELNTNNEKEKIEDELYKIPIKDVKSIISFFKILIEIRNYYLNIFSVL